MRQKDTLVNSELITSVLVLPVLFAAKHVLRQRGLESHLTAVSNIESLQQRTL